MLIKYFQWNSILLLFLSLYLTQLVNGNRENLAQRHPCYTVNKLLLPYIKWTEKLASTQYKGKFSMRRKRRKKILWKFIMELIHIVGRLFLYLSITS